MALRIILHSLFILLFFSSCARETFIFSANTGGNGSVYKAEPTVPKSSDTSPQDHAEAIARAPENPQAESEGVATPSQPLHISTILENQRIAPVPVGLSGKAFEENSISKNHQRATLTPRMGAGSLNGPREGAGYVLSLLSFALAVAGLVLTFSFGQFYFLFFAVPAILAGLISRSKKHKLKGFTIAGLILGLLEALLILFIISNDIHLKQ